MNVIYISNANKFLVSPNFLGREFEKFFQIKPLYARWWYNINDTVESILATLKSLASVTCCWISRGTSWWLESGCWSTGLTLQGSSDVLIFSSFPLKSNNYSKIVLWLTRKGMDSHTEWQPTKHISWISWFLLF